jgi:hypothetical protein
MVALVSLPSYKPNPLMDFSSIDNAIDSRNQAAWKLAQMGEDTRRWNATNQLNQGRFDLQKAQDARAAEMAPLRRDLVQAQIAAARRAAAAPIDDGSKVVEVNGQIVRVPRQGPAQVLYGSNPTDTRRAQAREIGLTPGSPEEQFFLANGKLPAKQYENQAHLAKRTQTGANIAEGLRNAQKIATKYDRASFENAVGPYQGSTPDGLVGGTPIMAARGLGEIKNWWDGGKNSPTEVRSDIQGSTEALAAAIKPLIRGPGEGVWTDADQARLVSIVGDLATSRSVEEYNRRLNAVRDRVKANFNLDIDFDAMRPADGAGRFSAPRGNSGWSVREIK